jgi:hypothetical protein
MLDRSDREEIDARQAIDELRRKSASPDRAGDEIATRP